ncbi:DUF4192 domain-containing protein [Nocardia rhamnosiphila]|uniref:DUF4192 domain-containing protein n=1 Tax=Nocardia rhamnosiphila TaxID=426716 RepID=UPI00340F7C44
MTDQNQPATTPPDPTPVLDDPGEFIASIPAILGFIPHRSLVVAMLGMPAGQKVGVIRAVLRGDLHDLEQVVDSVARACAANGADAVLVVLVDDQEQPTAPGDLVLMALQDGLDGIPVRGAWAVRRIAAGQRWHSLRPPHRDGLMPDPSTTVIALHRVYEGRQLHTGRRDIEDLLAPLPALADAVDQHLEAAKSENDPSPDSDPQARTRDRVESVFAMVAAQHAGAVLSSRALADIVVFWRESAVRDATLALAGTIFADTAEELATTLTRASTGTDRAHAAAVLAFLAYHRGDGVLAGIAIDAALTADAHHSLAALLGAALDSAMPVTRIQALARQTRDALTAAGVSLPPSAASPDQS